MPVLPNSRIRHHLHITETMVSRYYSPNLLSAMALSVPCWQRLLSGGCWDFMGENGVRGQPSLHRPRTCEKLKFPISALKVELFWIIWMGPI